MTTNIRALVPLLLAAALLLGGNGLQGTLVALRAGEEGFSTLAVGLIGAAYFAGFLGACFAVPPLIRAVGHVRVFAALASVAGVGTLLLVLAVDPWVWAAVRAVMGFCFSGLFVVVESWLNGAAGRGERGRVLSIYRIVDLSAVTGGQFLLPVFGVAGFEIFAVTAILFALSLLPVALTNASRPVPPERFRFEPMLLWRLSPVAALGALSIGLTTSAFRLIGPLYGVELGFDTAQVALFMNAGIVGGAVLQLPLGTLSDRVDRRWALLIATSGAVLAGLWLNAAHAPAAVYGGAFAFGAFALPLYSLAAAQANDRAGADADFVGISTGLIFVYSVGAIFGPLGAAALVEAFGPQALFGYTSAVHGAMAVLTVAQMIARAPVPREGRGRVVGLLRTSTGIFSLAQRRRMGGGPEKNGRTEGPAESNREVRS
ncbi:MFS transporter [Jannaschia sp. W003]|uniref:MFS transporter n=1 Tax=Jannaschia sp. W003 TaxID=2867012 RepID=UPI0021A761B4|nr:MFS transporter [Jannaschia sp. W003]UWQ22122.1 MFS transporter [Jannaschia sp. W003]